MTFSSVRYKGITAVHFVINSLLVALVHSEKYAISGLSGWLPCPENTHGYQQDISWNIEVPTGLRVALAFVEFDIEQLISSYLVCDSSVKVYADDIEIGNFCGRRESRNGPRDIIRSSNNHLKVHFTPGYHKEVIVAVEFKAYYYAEDIDECLDQNGGCEHLCHNVYGGFYCSCSPGYRLHSDGRTCKVKPRTSLLTENSGELDTKTLNLSINGLYHHDWTIVAESGHVIALNFNAFNIIEMACSVLFVKIYTGNEEFGPFCGDEHVSNLPTIIYSTTNVMTIRYLYHSSSEAELVQARYNITDLLDT
ncbi:mannan-binding lectin serine protease 1-like [Ptychodera flava]|uniref:mannan-binding lectin serine protease 1-like n=1 Tax=Ptychodera flava TaxID=63121 RepID=UPI00396A6DFF